MYRLAGIAVIGGVSALLAGCSQAASDLGAGPVELVASDSGRTLQIAGQAVVRVTLDSNITTGYSWKLAPLEGGVVEQTKQEYIAPQTQAMGAGGREVWTFTARNAGRTPLRLEYVQPWMAQAKPAKVFEVTLVVR